MEYWNMKKTNNTSKISIEVKGETIFLDFAKLMKNKEQ